MPAPRAHIILVEPDVLTRGLLQAAAARIGEVESYGHFDAARARVRLGAFSFLVTNIRLGAYNGLHLVYLSPPAGDGPRAIVYSDERDPALAREAQRAGAFYEVGATLPIAMGSYFAGHLPAHDRRNAGLPDRRTQFRGGRRGWDRHLVHHAH